MIERADVTRTTRPGTHDTVLFVLLYLLFLHLPSPVAQAAAVNATSCQRSDIQAAINAAGDGDIVEVPACPSGVSWDTGTYENGGPCTTGWGCASVHIPNTKGITLRGRGVDQTVITTNVGIAIQATTRSGNSPVALTGLDFRPGTGVSDQGLIVIRGQTKDWRVHHNRFGTATQPYGYRQFWIGHDFGDCTYGLWDHNTHYGSGGTGDVKFGGCNGGGNYGDNVWKAPLNWGGPDWMFFENNTFYCTTSSYGTGCGAPDNASGARIVYRHNFVEGQFVASHGAESTGRPRGVRALDVYNNTVVNQVVWRDALGSVRSGTARIHDNNISSAVPYQRMGKVWIANWDNSRGLPYGNCRDAPAEGLCSGDYKTACIGNSDCSAAGGVCEWVHNPAGDGNGYPCRDQPGRGLDTGVTTVQVLEPIYSWGNSGPNTSLEATTEGVLENRDFYNCSSYQDCLDKGMPAYQTYTYPHPLQGNADTVAPAAPSNLTVQ